MPDGDALALGRLGRVLGWLDAAPAPLDERSLDQATRLAARLWGDLFERAVGAACRPGWPSSAATGFAPRPAAADRDRYRAWHMVQGGLFLHYAPVAGRLIEPEGRPEDRAAALLITDALRLIDSHAAGLGGACAPHAAIATPAAPFARLVQRSDRPRSGQSSDVNLGAVALGLAVESGMRHALGLQGGARLSMWRLFRALAAEAARVRLTVDLPVLVAVYNWAGRHRSAGCRDAGWLNYYAADLLHPLFVPPAALGLAFGLEADPATLARLRAAASDGGREAVPPSLALVAAA